MFFNQPIIPFDIVSNSKKRIAETDMGKGKKQIRHTARRQFDESPRPIQVNLDVQRLLGESR